MLKLKKILETIIVFILIMLLICLSISICNVLNGNIEANQILNKTGLYFLYTIGYGALEGDAMLQNILAIIGIVALALMSTFLTINLFWRLDDVVLEKNNIIFSNNFLNFNFKNKGRTICYMKINFVLYDKVNLKSSDLSREYFIPMLMKKSNRTIKADINDTFWYKVIYDLLTNPNKRLYCMFSFVDTKNGQNSIKVEEITSKDIKTSLGSLRYEEFITPNIISSKKLFSAENGGTINLQYKDNYTEINYKFNNTKDSGKFVMSYYNFHNDPLNLEKYNKETTYIEFYAVSDKALELSLEIKMPNGVIHTEYKKITEKEETVQIPISNIRGNLENINEICFTIFEKDNEKSNSFKIGDLSIVTK